MDRKISVLNIVFPEQFGRIVFHVFLFHIENILFLIREKEDVGEKMKIDKADDREEKVMYIN